jgi:hypothetical protein
MNKELICDCLKLLNNSTVKNEIKEFFRPVLELMLQEIFPYIYLSLLFVLVSFFLILAIFILLLKNNSK